MKGLYVFGLKSQFSGVFSANYYEGPDNYYLSPTVKLSDVSGTWLRKEIDNQIRLMS